MALPTNVSYGTVVGQFLLAYGDGPDVDPRPDGVPAKGSIFFRPSPIKLLNPGAEPNPVTILPAVVEAVLDAEGYLLGGDGERGMRLVATDDEDLNPSGWTWEVEFRLTDQDDVPVRIPAFNIELPGETEVDLTTVSPVPSANGVFYIVGPAGPSNELTVGTVSTLAPEQNATVDITGSSPNQTINFGIPQGFAATVDVGTTTTIAPGQPATVTNSGDTAEAVFDFEIPQGAAATVDAGTTTTVAPGTPAGVTNSGTTAEAIFDFEIPQGAAATVDAGTTTTGAPGTNASVVNSGTTAEAVFDFTIPRGDKGDAATVDVGTTTTGAPGTSASVTNSGDTTNAVFNFTIPEGIQGERGFGYEGITSTTSTAVGIGSKVFTVNKIDALMVGNRVRLADAANVANFVEGLVTDITGLAVTVLVDHTGGSGVIASWNLGLTGARGDQGPTGSIESLTASAPVVYSGGNISFDWTSTVLDDLGNVTFTNKVDSDLIKWNSASSQWENSNVIDGGNA